MIGIIHGEVHSRASEKKRKNTGLENVKAISTPLEILREKLSRANIIIAQKTELTELYAKCLASDNFEYIRMQLTE